MELTKSGFAPISIEAEVNGKTVVISVDEFRGKTYLSARFMYIDHYTGELEHTKNGINIQIDGDEGMEAALVIIEAMQKALTLTHQEQQESNNAN